MKHYLILFILTTIFIGCSNFPETEEMAPPQTTRSNLGAQNSKPYPLEIMQQAFNEVSQTKLTRSNNQLTPTHHLIEFSPSTFDEYYRIQSDFECQFQYNPEIEISGDQNYADVITEGDSPDKLYALIGKDEYIPDYITNYQTIEEYYTPFASDSGISDFQLASLISEKAANISGIYPNASSNTRLPKGSVHITDSKAMDKIPLVGVKVAIYFIPKEESVVRDGEIVYTDENGNFQGTQYVDESKFTISYNIIWQDSNWIITDSKGNTARTHGVPDANNEWHVCITTPAQTLEISQSFGYASAHRILYAAQHNGIPAPTHYNDLLKIKCYQTSPSLRSEDCKTTFYDISNNKAPLITIYCQDKSTTDLMKLLASQLGKIAMYEYSPQRYSYIAQYIQDSWGMYVIYHLLIKEYERTGDLLYLMPPTIWQGKIGPAPNEYDLQPWVFDKKDKDNSKSPLFIDLRDNFNQALYYEDTLEECRPYDEIFIQDFEEIQNIAFGSENLTDIRAKVLSLKDKYNFSSGDVTILFRTYFKFEDDL
ncbi:hypothetical protein [uncultured Alistipes sp.]|uniref:hypothetical protein n=1 Tax=uncultured Alistipes sp. TaxID=538949 RepID=UPI0026197FBD|nr:hypothetical protein [uncultured Alistipes sp.]